MSRSSTLRLALACLALGLLGLALAACGGGGTTTVIETVTEADTTATPEPETTGGGESQPEPEPEPSADELQSFQSPSGNIGCIVGPEGARCDVVERDWTAPRPPDCPAQVDFGQGVEVGQSGPGRVVCAGDTALDPTAPKLAYGSEIQAGDFTCHSRKDGVECLDDGDGRGFVVSKQSYRLF